MNPKIQTPSIESALAPDSEESTLIESDSLVEEISIDGMCGVY